MSVSELCLLLMRADTANDAIAVLQEAGYWDNLHCWRYLDDNESNFSSIGNQQSDPIAALIEKIVNGIDARLMNACLVAGIAPDGPAAPASIREAVARFFEDKQQPHPDRDGKIAFWSDDRLTEEGRLLTLSATGHMPSVGWPSLTIADQGEGQTPDAFPETFMSLSRGNKLRVPFVQGKFNMGGTGALMFSSGGHNLQLIVSRRNPALLDGSAVSRDTEWGFTVVRRDFPPGGRSSVFRYLVHPG